MFDYTKLKQELLDEKEKLTKSISETNDLQKSGSDELSQYDNHPADTASELTERTTTAALKVIREDSLRKIDEALRAMDEGTYGICKECGIEIPYERLEAVPEALYCVDHVPKKQQHERPVEEDVIKEIHAIERDSVDSYAAIASHGTSETPSDFIGSVISYSDINSPDDDNES